MEGINLFAWAPEAVPAQVFLALQGHATALEQVVSKSLADTRARVHALLLKVPRDRHGRLDADTSEFLALDGAVEDSADLERRLRILRAGIYIVAFAEFERVVLASALTVDGSEFGNVVKAVSSVATALKRDFAVATDLQERVAELTALRNEMVHGGRILRRERRQRLAGLLSRGEVILTDENGNEAIAIQPAFVDSALFEFYRGNLCESPEIRSTTGARSPE